MWHGCKCPAGGELQNYLACQLALFTGLRISLGCLAGNRVEMLTGGIGIGFCGMNGAA